MKVNGNTILLTRSTIETSLIAGKLTFKLFVLFPKNFRFVSILFSACRRRTCPFSVFLSEASVSKLNISVISWSLADTYFRIRVRGPRLEPFEPDSTQIVAVRVDRRWLFKLTAPAKHLTYSDRPDHGPKLGHQTVPNMHLKGTSCNMIHVTIHFVFMRLTLIDWI